MALAVLVFGLVRAAVWGTWHTACQLRQAVTETVAGKLISRCIYYLCALPERALLKDFHLAKADLWS